MRIAFCIFGTVLAAAVLGSCGPHVRLRGRVEIEHLRLDRAEERLCEEEPETLCCPPATYLMSSQDASGHWMWCEFEDGTWDGPFRLVSSDAPETVFGHYQSGVKHGRWQILSGGVVVIEQHYERGVLHGPWKSYERGALEASGAYHKGEKHGIWRAWSSDGTMLHEKAWELGVLHGVWREWRDDGSAVVEGGHEHGLRQGPWRFYYLSGVLWKEGRYEKGEAVGEWIRWYEKNWAGLRCDEDPGGADARCETFTWRGDMLRRYEKPMSWFLKGLRESP